MVQTVSARDLTIVEKMLCAGSAACIADLFTFPFDVAKVRLQVMGEVVAAPALTSSGTIALQGPEIKGLFGTLLHLSKTEGMKGLYGGIGPGLQRQCVFASIRIGIYDNVRDFYTDHLSFGSHSTSSVMAARILSGITTGAIAISFAQPTDVVKVRMQAQIHGASSKVMYKSSFHAYQTIFRAEGLQGLWRGLGPNMVRNSIVNATELVCYDSIKDLLISRKILRDSLPCHFAAAFSAGFCATIVASPIDVVKTRIMNSKVGKYQGIFDCAKCLVNESGLKAFYKGFTPSFMRLGTWNICMFVSYEQLKKLMAQYQQNKEMEAKANKVAPVVSRNEILRIPAL